MAFDYALDFKKINFRDRPELYRVGVGEQGVLLMEPYKSELLPFWRFKNPTVARVSASRLLEAFYDYAKVDDFAGMDMARKFLQMGFTRSRRYANHRSGKKYAGPVPYSKKGRSGAHGRPVLKKDEDLEKAQSAEIFKRAWEEVENFERYKALKAEWKHWYG